MKKPIIDVTPDPHPECLTLAKVEAAVRLIEDLERGVTEESKFANAKDVDHRTPQPGDYSVIRWLNTKVS
jgi:hypothetical protein